MEFFTFSSKFIMLNSASFANFVPRGSRNSLSFLMRAATASEAQMKVQSLYEILL